MASSFEKAFTQAYQADVARRREEEAQIAREIRAAKQAGLERVMRKAEREKEQAELYKRQDLLAEREVDRRRLERQEGADEALITQLDRDARAETAIEKERQRIEDEARFLSSARTAERYPGVAIDYGSADWRDQEADVKEAAELSQKLKALGASGIGPWADVQPIENIGGIPVPKVSPEDYGRLAEAERKQGAERLKQATASQARLAQLKDTTDFVFGLEPSKRKKGWFSDTGEITEAAVRDVATWGKVDKEPIIELGEIKGYKNVYRYAEDVPPLWSASTQGEKGVWQGPPNQPPSERSAAKPPSGNAPITPLLPGIAPQPQQPAPTTSSRSGSWLENVLWDSIMDKKAKDEKPQPQPAPMSPFRNPYGF